MFSNNQGDMWFICAGRRKAWGSSARPSSAAASGFGMDGPSHSDNCSSMVQDTRRPEVVKDTFHTSVSERNNKVCWVELLLLGAAAAAAAA